MAAARETLLDSLDALLGQYLVLLDQYTTAREQLSTALASGFISLAQANFNSPNRVRYGQDLYDERMQALRAVSIDETGPALTRAIGLVKTTGEPPSPSSDPADEAPPNPNDPAEITASDKDNTPQHAAEGETHPTPRDPIRMFGILVPPALRTSQAHFVRAVEGPVPRLANLAAELRALEIEIGRARKAVRKCGGGGGEA
ncbi:uncharacterized protein K452DRAFT_294815 [Aplosporella prunicola CBS 121167]|uniref:Vacuolar ATPase assembly protein VMA22 n=1 Tax=Aplosporella prunicola CBS 121167 TaxID=1176127 RepID=A0A6A6BQ22_9PEZI|nr:uncharacterized protein K452DRAFT_294815 [Aplosporella prunicola CBS 121167]KAF2146232.1 hypothetical protein K452DRAFT_294815 [Aplosporella prunicola CBS 121167]